MSTETNIEFRCGECGHDEIASLETGVTIVSRVTRLVPWDYDPELPPLSPMPVISGHSRTDGIFAGFGCGKCHKIVARTPRELYEHLQGRGMIGENRTMD